MRRTYWYSGLTGFGAGLLFIIATFSIPALRTFVADAGRFAWSFSLFCSLCFVLFAATSRARRKFSFLLFSLLFFIFGAAASYILILLAVGVIFALWQPQIL